MNPEAFHGDFIHLREAKMFTRDEARAQMNAFVVGTRISSNLNFLFEKEKAIVLEHILSGNISTPRSPSPAGKRMEGSGVR